MAEHDSEREDREPEERGVPFDEDAAWAAIVAGYGEEPKDPPGAKPFKSVEDLALLEPGTNDPVEPEVRTGPNKSGRPDGADGPDGPGASGRPDGPGGPDGIGASGRPEAPAETSGPVAPGPAAPGAGGTGTGEADAGKAEKAEPAGPAGPARPAGPGTPLGGSISFAPGVGPRDYTPKEPAEGDFDEDDEGHFVPPEPPPLPDADATAKFAWLGLIGGPVLLLVAVLLGWDMTWWLATLCIGGFLGGFATLVVRMGPDDEDDGNPGRGAVV
ncbi:hypothetical protein ACIRPS_27490 [Streptomyces griseoviridis]